MQAQEQLRGLLDQEVENLQSLHNILQREYNALVNAEIEALEQVTVLKNQALSIQAGLTNNRGRLVISILGSAEEDRLAQYVAASGDAQLENLFSRLSSLAQECHELNRTNGRLIAQKQQHTLGALDILRHTDSTGSTYSFSGKTDSADQSGRTLGKA
ncbi:MAG: flagellar protein FlgN [Halioglobus sp.]|nr:flagellar protein FlgN [Halioglobus sp.]